MDVSISFDDGIHWSPAKLDRQAGKYAWRRFRYAWTPPKPGAYRIMSCATNQKGETQTPTQWNRSGYQRNVIDPLDVTVV